MADLTHVDRPLTRDSVRAAHERIKPYIHETPVLTCATLSALASTPQTPAALRGTAYEGRAPARPRIALFFKCEHLQKVGAFKARGAFHALSRLSAGELANGVVTHSSGNHAQALALAAAARGVPAHIVMPRISTPSKIAATRGYGAHVVFSGSTAPEREAVLRGVQARTGAVFVPPYDHPDIVLGQGTVALEFEAQVKALGAAEREADAAWEGFGWRARRARAAAAGGAGAAALEGLDAVVAPVGGGGLLGGVAVALAGTGVAVFGAEPAFEGADDCRRGLAATPPARVEHVSSLTIADGARTPVGAVNWAVVSDGRLVRGVYAASEAQITAALRLLLERAKVFVEPTAALPLAVVLFDEDFRALVEREAGPDGWNVGVVLSGGNTTVEAIAALFGPGAGKGHGDGAEADGETDAAHEGETDAAHEGETDAVHEGERATATVTPDGDKVAQDVAG